ncbi:hypothetical protein GCM10022221_29520 [Actinocorallia aurea]
MRGKAVGAVVVGAAVLWGMASPEGDAGRATPVASAGAPAPARETPDRGGIGGDRNAALPEPAGGTAQAVDQEDDAERGSTVAEPTARMPEGAAEDGRVDCRKKKCVALTFDDGPGSRTPELLRTLRRAEVRATFFVVGTRARADEGVLARAHADGHEIGVHTENHPDLTTLPDSRIRREIDRTLRTIKDQTGRRPVLMRPPYGATNARVAAQARDLGVAQILWDVDPVDWRDRDSAVVARRVIADLHRGAIILLHDIRPTTVAAVPRILKAAEAKGYTFVTVSELLGPTEPGKIYTRAHS